ncbi:MAG: hypothetical protein Q8867_10885, partial [Bacteroidota bacterium]|nr:hypothetical protein [Bacteroidota bacterium]
MKKLINTFVFLILAGCIPLFAANINVKPIPSYNVPVKGQQAFAELSNSLNNPTNKGKRTMAVKATVSYSNNGVNSPSTYGPDDPIQVYAVCIDTKQVKGPYFMVPDQTIYIPIDYYDWGVNVVSDIIGLQISVWIINGDIPTGNDSQNTTESMNPWAESIVNTLNI